MPHILTSGGFGFDYSMYNKSKQLGSKHSTTVSEIKDAVLLSDRIFQLCTKQTPVNDNRASLETALNTVTVTYTVLINVLI